MIIKRLYHPDKIERDEQGNFVRALPGSVRGVRLLRADKDVQHFSPNFVEGGVAEGWLSMADGKLTIRAEDGEAVWRIVRAPGHYCCHCDAALPDANLLTPSGKTQGQLHVESAHAGKPSPDPNNPAGYRRDNFWACVRADGSGWHSDASTDEVAAVERKIRLAQWASVGPKHKARSLVLGGGADFVFNIAKGRVAELYNRVDTNDPTNSALIIIIIDANGDTDATMKDRDDISALLGGTANEVTNTNYARKTLTDSDIVAFAPDDTNDRVDLDIPDQTWTAVAAGTAWTDFIVSYDSDTTGGTDSGVVPLTLHDFAVTPDGSDITAQVSAAGFFRAA